MILPPPPPKFSDLPVGTQLVAGLGHSTVFADIDFETYSPAGFVWNDTKRKFDKPPGASKKGLPVVGAAVYTEHPDAEVLSCAYDLKDGRGKRLWIPGDPNPQLLFEHVIAGHLLEAWNASFEFYVWRNICIRRYGWPHLNMYQLRCAAAKARAHALPGSLEPAGTVLNTAHQKDKDGKRLLNKFSIPRNPTKNNPSTRNYLRDHPVDARKLYDYNIRDIETEAEISSLVPDLTDDEQRFWLCDQYINRRGVQIDSKMVNACLMVVKQAHEKYNSELVELTNGEVQRASEVAKLKKWLSRYGIDTSSLDADAITELLALPELPDVCKRVLQIRELIGSAAVKKLYAMNNQLSSKGRIHDLFIYHSARTGRAAGTGAQPQNLPNSGIEVNRCRVETCARHFNAAMVVCPWCGSPYTANPGEWNTRAVEDALHVIATRSVECVEYFFGDAIATISGCLRGMIIASPGHDLICSDFSAIEAVVLAALAGEEWQTEVFRTHGMIYETTASKITGISLDDFDKHRLDTGGIRQPNGNIKGGQPHPQRKLGKTASLASGYQGWIGAWKQFGADEFFSDDEIKTAILAWREASPAIVEMWGGQQRRWATEYYGLEGAAVQAVLTPGYKFSYRSISYLMSGDALYCQLPSGRYITYHRPRLAPSDRREGTLSLSYEGWNTNPKNGMTGWIRMNTYAGKLTENIVQAVARDILAHAIINLEKSGYPVVLHVHDEIVSEVPEGHGAVEEFEKIMADLPQWAKGWPISANGGWRAKRYAK